MKKIRDILFHRYSILAIAVVLIFSGGYLYRSSFISVDGQRLAANAENVLRESAIYANEWFKSIRLQLHSGQKNAEINSSENELHAVMVFREQQPVFWTNSRIPFDTTALDTLGKSGMIHLRNGWYFFNHEHLDDEHSGIVFTQVRKEYVHKNRYLSDHFHSAWGIPDEVNLVEPGTEKSFLVRDENGNAVFALLLSEATITSGSSLYLIAGLLLFGIVLLIRFLKEECENLEKFIGPFYSSLLLVFSVVLLRYWSLSMEFPAAFYAFELFQPDLFAASFFLPSLGDYLINAFLILYLFYFLDARSSRFNYHLSSNKGAAIGIIAFLLGVLMAFGHSIGFLMQGLIEDSNIEFNINNIFNLSTHSFIGFTIVGLLYFAFYLFCDFTFRVAKKLQIEKLTFLVLLGVFSIFSTFALYLWGVTDPFQIIWPLTILFLLFAVRFVQERAQLSFNVTVLLLIIFSGFTAHALSKFTGAKERKNRIVLAERLSTDEDPLVEILFSEMEAGLRRSELLNSAFDSSAVFSKTAFEEQLEKEYFSGDWNAFDIQFYLFAADSTPVGLEGFAPIREFSDLDNVILENGIPSKFSGNMNFIYNSTNKLSYIIKLPVSARNEAPKGYLFCELRSKKIPEDIGFPELLIDKGSNKIDLIHQYSYARYVDSVQVNHFGPFRYSLMSTPYAHLPGKIEFLREDESDHLVYRVDDRTLIVLTRPVERFINQATSFSYLFTLFCLIVIAGVVYRQFSRGFSGIHLTLQGKLQFLLVSVLLVSLVLFGLGTRYYVAGQYRAKNYNIISEKIQSVRIEVTHKLGRERELSSDLRNYIGYILGKFSGVFLTDINLYDDNGLLVATSRPRIFQSGLLGMQMDPEAFRQMNEERRSEFIQEERIGNMNYLSAYVPLLNDHSQLLGYLNLPYFAKQNTLETELTGFLVAILNIFVVLFALSILAALFVSNWITKPLRLVQQSIAGIQLGRTNKPIAYSGRDEIGSLVEEYNKKVQELERYAQELAATERESAWREMAKQVAHEIKNPLTPIRLSIQHLQRSLHSDDPDWKEKLDRFTHTVIEQIDALSNIANEFSNFAKMPKAEEEVLDLKSVLSNAVELYKDTPDVSVRLSRTDLTDALVYADKDQLIRVVNNLIKNAIQAIPEDREGKVEISLRRNDNRYLVEVKDNGSGIPHDRIDKIFTPNFTTKSTGMGLGLAMVKNIVENHKGRIWFETSHNVGTSFYFTLPVHEA
ncbi:MAG: ATP-binding protein [Flavobacteriales bacterium]